MNYYNLNEKTEKLINNTMGVITITDFINYFVIAFDTILRRGSSLAIRGVWMVTILKYIRLIFILN